MQPAPSTTVGAVPPGTAVVYMPVPIGSNIYECYRHKQSICLGITQIIISILCIIINIFSLVVNSDEGLGHFGHGYWCGIVFMITGIFGIIAGKKRTGCQIVAFMVLCIISAVFTIFLLIFGITGALTTRRCNSYDYGPEDYYIKTYCSIKAKSLIVTLASCLAILGFVEAVVAIWGSVLCCRSGVCCCSSPMMAMPAVGQFPNTGHMIYMTQVQGGQQISAPQPNVSYPQGQSPPSVYAQPATSIGAVFSQEPPPYATCLEQPLWMIPPAKTNPGPLAAQASPTDPYPTKERA